MRTVKLNQSEMIKILDALHPNAYDLLQSALEEKAMDELGGELWLKRWASDNWNVELNLNIGE